MATLDIPLPAVLEVLAVVGRVPLLMERLERLALQTRVVAVAVALATMATAVPVARVL